LGVFRLVVPLRTPLFVLTPFQLSSARLVGALAAWCPT
jgi:hypothetical protein